MTIEIVQLIMNFLALCLGGVAVKYYIESLKESISQVTREREAWKGRAETAESRTPESMEKNLNDRIKIREEELNRLKNDVDSNSDQIESLSNEIRTLRETLRGAGGFLQMLALDEGSEVEGFEFDPEDFEIRHIGMIGVDSGQVMITDPCYIDSEWRQENFEDLRVVRDPQTQKAYRFREDFQNYSETLPGYDQSVSLLLESGRLEEVPPKYEKTGSFSYAGACHTTLGHGGGQLNYRNGEPGAGVVLSTGWGDGFYPVYGEIREGRMYRIYVSV